VTCIRQKVDCLPSGYQALSRAGSDKVAREETAEESQETAATGMRPGKRLSAEPTRTGWDLSEEAMLEGSFSPPVNGSIICAHGSAGMLEGEGTEGSRQRSPCHVGNRNMEGIRFVKYKGPPAKRRQSLLCLDFAFISDLFSKWKQVTGL
jgi:hypothetical protein